MKIISLTLIPFLISMASLPTLIKAPAVVAGGSSNAINGPTGPGYKSGDPTTGYRTGGPGAYKSGDIGSGYHKGGDTGSGYKNGSPVTPPGKRPGGGDAGAAIVVFPKKPIRPRVPVECSAVADCVTTHITGDNPKEPQYHGKCCTVFKTKVSCVCKFLMSMDAKQQEAADGVVRACHFINPICIKKPLPGACRPEVKHCVQMHMYKRAANPTYRSPCCQKFKTSKRCIMAFKNSPDPHLSQAAKGVIAGCRFT